MLLGKISLFCCVRFVNLVKLMSALNAFVDL